MSSPAVPILFGGLIAWSIYRRARRNIGRQKLRPRRAIVSIVILSAITVLIVGTSLQNTNLLLGFGGGLLPGALLGFVGLRLTKFETTGEGHFYTPNTHIGVALSVLFIGRMAYRFIVAGNMANAQNSPTPFQSPLTLFILGLTVGYYIVYQIGILVHNHDKNDSGKKTSPPDQN
jgi:hypothetical protein